MDRHGQSQSRPAVRQSFPRTQGGVEDSNGAVSGVHGGDKVLQLPLRCLLCLVVLREQGISHVPHCIQVEL